MSYHLGAEIRKILKQRGMTVSEFARRINKSRENIYSIFKRKSLDTELLKNISAVLHYDFFNRTAVRRKVEGSGLVEEPKPAYSKMEREIEFLREEMIHIRKELQYLRDQVADKPKAKVSKRRK